MMNKRSNKTTLHTSVWCTKQELRGFCLIIVLENLFYILLILIASLLQQQPTAMVVSTMKKMKIFYDNHKLKQLSYVHWAIFNKLVLHYILS